MPTHKLARVYLMATDALGTEKRLDVEPQHEDDKPGVIVRLMEDDAVVAFYLGKTSDDHFRIDVETLTKAEVAFRRAFNAAGLPQPDIELLVELSDSVEHVDPNPCTHKHADGTTATQSENSPTGFFAIFCTLCKETVGGGP